MDELITQDNLILMRFSEVVIDHIEKLGVTSKEAEQTVYNAWQELGRAYANPNTEKLQESRAGDCENVYYI